MNLTNITSCQVCGYKDTFLTMKHDNIRKFQTFQANNLAETQVKYQNVDDITPFLAATKAENIQTETIKPELALIGIDLIIFSVSCVFMVASAHLLNPWLQLQESLTVSINLALAAGFSVIFKYYNLEEGLYSLGKAILIAISLWLLNGLILLTVSGFTTPAMLIAGGLLMSSAFISALFHYKLSVPYHIKNTASVYYQLEKGLKRAFDLSFSIVGLILASPLILGIAMSIRFESQGAAIYKQIRIGEREKKFQMLKFRSMKKDADTLQIEKKAVLYKKENDPRVTRLGKIIRKLSIDELPQLWNVICGDMSLVGPRPPIESEYKLMNWYHRRKFEVTPGLTGLWQIVGRVKNQRDFNSVAAYDIYYIENWCLLKDLEILVKTIPVVLLQKGAC